MPVITAAATMSTETTVTARGAISAGMITDYRMLPGSIAEVPTPAITAPISACDDVDGTPNHHVIRFQVIARTGPAKIIVGDTASASTIPFVTVAATVIEMKAPPTFIWAAMPTAMRGLRAPVAIVVAMALAVSWRPFGKSKTSATTTRSAMGDDGISETRSRPEARPAELKPLVDEAARIEAALAALKNGPRPPVTTLDRLKPVPPAGGNDR